MKKMAKKSYIFLIFLMTSAFFWGCGVVTLEKDKLQDLPVELVGEEEEPEELKVLIAERQAEPFQFSYQVQDIKYLVVGYGQQETGGYSISVDQLYETANAIFIETNLIGPYKGEQVIETKTYPYVVVRIPATEKSVVFQ